MVVTTEDRAAATADSGEAVRQLEEVRARGAGFLVIPKPAFWWREYYPEFQDHLAKHYRKIGHDDSCLVFDLGGRHG